MKHRAPLANSHHFFLFVCPFCVTSAVCGVFGEALLCGKWFTQLRAGGPIQKNERAGNMSEAPSEWQKNLHWPERQSNAKKKKLGKPRVLRTIDISQVCNTPRRFTKRKQNKKPNNNNNKKLLNLGRMMRFMAFWLDQLHPLFFSNLSAKDTFERYKWVKEEGLEKHILCT